MTATTTAKTTRTTTTIIKEQQEKNKNPTQVGKIQHVSNENLKWPCQAFEYKFKMYSNKENELILGMNARQNELGGDSKGYVERKV